MDTKRSKMEMISVEFESKEKTKKLRLQEVVLHSKILSDVGLVQHDNRGGIQIFTILRGLRRDAEPQRNVAHAVHHGAPVLGRILRYSP